MIFFYCSHYYTRPHADKHMHTCTDTSVLGNNIILSCLPSQYSAVDLTFSNIHEIKKNSQATDSPW